MDDKDTKDNELDVQPIASQLRQGRGSMFEDSVLSSNDNNSPVGSVCSELNVAIGIENHASIPGAFQVRPAADELLQYEEEKNNTLAQNVPRHSSRNVINDATIQDFLDGNGNGTGGTRHEFAVAISQYLRRRQTPTQVMAISTQEEERPNQWCRSKFPFAVKTCLLIIACFITLILAVMFVRRSQGQQSNVIPPIPSASPLQPSNPPSSLPTINP